MEPAGLALVGEPVPLEANPDHGAYLLVEAAGPLDTVPGMEEAVLAADAAQRQRLWDLREHHTEAIARLPGPPAHKLDVALPLTTIAAFRAQLAALGADVIVFGHLAVGNLHVNVLHGTDALDDAILRLVAEHQGSIAAEHRVGTAKARYLLLTSTEADLEARRRIKRALDPGNVLNPGVILPAR
jgi:FAD/FMN-containing dehydrogenase